MYAKVCVLVIIILIVWYSVQPRTNIENILYDTNAQLQQTVSMLDAQSLLLDKYNDNLETARGLNADREYNRALHRATLTYQRAALQDAIEDQYLIYSDFSANRYGFSPGRLHYINQRAQNHHARVNGLGHTVRNQHAKVIAHARGMGPTTRTPRPH